VLDAIVSTLVLGDIVHIRFFGDGRAPADVFQLAG